MARRSARIRSRWCSNILSIADRAYILDDGKVVYSGKATELAKDTELVNKLAGAGSKAAHAASAAPVAPSV